MCPIVSVFDPGAGPNLIRVDVLDQSWMENIRQRDMPEVRNDLGTKLVLSETIILHLCMCKSHIWVASSVVDKLFVPVLLRTTFIDRFEKSFHPTKRNIVPYHFPTVLILVLHEARGEAERNASNIRQINDQDVALLMTRTKCEPKYIKVFRQVVLN